MDSLTAIDLQPGDTIIIDGRKRIIRDIRRLRYDTGLTFFYEGPHVGNLPKNNSESYLNHFGFKVVDKVAA